MSSILVLLFFNSAPIGWWTESNIYFPPVHGGISDSPESGICCCLTGCLSVMGLGGAVGAFAPPAPLSKTPQIGFSDQPEWAHSGKVFSQYSEQTGLQVMWFNG